MPLEKTTELAPGQDRQQTTTEEDREAERRTSVRAKIVHEAIRRDGETELARGPSALAWSALAAGLSMGTSLLAQGIFQYYLPGSRWAPLVVNLGYSVGFIIVILGKQQLFTENTLTPIIPLMHNPTAARFRSVALLWLVVFCGNMMGAHLAAWGLGATPVLDDDVQVALARVAQHATSNDFNTTLIRGIPAGWLIAMIVWLRAAVDSGELMIIIILTWLVAMGGFSHIIAGSVDYLYLVARGDAAWMSWAMGFMVPALVGNAIGGVSITAALNHAQVVAEKKGR
jgi:formate/nitrite transporter FocA (FNT family)